MKKLFLLSLLFSRSLLAYDSYYLGDRGSIVQDIDEEDISRMNQFAGFEFLFGVGKDNFQSKIKQNASNEQSTIKHNPACLLVGVGKAIQNAQRIYVGFDALLAFNKRKGDQKMSNVYSSYDTLLNSGSMETALDRVGVKSPFSVKIEKMSSPIITLKVGYAPLSSKSLFFARLGICLSKIRVRMYGVSRNNDTISKDFCSANINQISPCLGIGFERKITDNCGFQLNLVHNFARKKTVQDGLDQIHTIKCSRTLIFAGLCFR